MKRRIVCICLFIALFLSLPLSARAAGTTDYRLDELGLSLSVPADYVVFTRDVAADDPNLAAYGLTKDKLVSLMTLSNIYLDAWDVGVKHELTVTMTQSEIKDFSAFSSADFSAGEASFASMYASLGATYIRSELYQHAQTVFYKIYFSMPNGNSTAYGLQYYTIYANQAINITIKTLSGDIGTAEEALLKDVVDSTKFDGLPQSTTTAVPSTTAPSTTAPSATAPSAATTEQPNTVTHASDTSTEAGQLSASELLLGLLLTLVIYTLPVILIRYAILRRPVSRKAGVWITIGYAILASMIMFLIIGFGYGNIFDIVAILLWSIVNYLILTHAKGKPQNEYWQNAPVPPPQWPQPPQQPGAPGYGNVGAPNPPALPKQFCTVCGNELKPGSLFCNNCGAKVQQNPANK